MSWKVKSENVSLRQGSKVSNEAEKDEEKRGKSLIALAMGVIE